MNYTDIQLRETLAKMFPDVVRLGLKGHVWWKNTEHVEMDDCPVSSTELLHLCWLVEETLNINPITVRDWMVYCSQLARVCDMPLCNSEHWQPYKILMHATWQQRTIALAKVKGVEIV